MQRAREMATRFSAAMLVGMLVVGLVIGVGGGFLYATESTHASTTTMTQTQPVTVVSTLTQTVATSSSAGVTSSATGPTLAMLQAALSNSQNATLSLASYDFGKGTLAMWVTNNASVPILLSPHDVVYNATYQSNIFFTVLDPHVIRYGIYAYIPPGSQIIIQVVPDPPPLTPSTATVQIFNNNFTFKYGTSTP